MRKILESQVQAAGILFDAMPSYKGTESALWTLAQRLKESTGESCLLKTVAVNGLLNTNLYDVSGMAEHVLQILENPDRENGPPLVDKLAQFKARKHLSFASKYAHFFLDAERYPIYDQYVLKAISHHLKCKHIQLTSYVEFFSWYKKLEPLCEPYFGTRELDRYLWLSEAHRRWQTKREKSGLGKEVTRLFGIEEPEIKSALVALLGD